MLLIQPDKEASTSQLRIQNEKHNIQINLKLCIIYFKI